MFAWCSDKQRSFFLEVYKINPEKGDALRRADNNLRIATKIFFRTSVFAWCCDKQRNYFLEVDMIDLTKGYAGLIT